MSKPNGGDAVAMTGVGIGGGALIAVGAIADEGTFVGTLTTVAEGIQLKRMLQLGIGAGKHLTVLGPIGWGIAVVDCVALTGYGIYCLLN